MFRLALCLALTATALFAQPASSGSQPPTLVANKPISLATKTPLGDATVQISPGTQLTNFEIQGEQVKIWQGPFTTTVGLAEVQPPSAEVSVAPEPTMTPTTISSPTPTAADPSPTPALEKPETSVSPGTTTLVETAGGMPSWVLPAICGALAAYAIFTTLAWLGLRRTKETKTGRASAAPVVAISPQVTAKPAVVSEEGRAIACPLCGKNIAIESVNKGRNHCPSCGGKFVGE
jgi:hypothetical protein